ncbi:ParB-like nuclease domain protein [compost metagenome]
MNTKKISIDKLFLDPNNYRLRSNPAYKEITGLTDDQITGALLQQRTQNIVGGKNNSEVLDLINSFKTNGFLKVDNILVRELKDDLGYVVVEGNRRTVALKMLKRSFDEGFDIGKMDPRLFDGQDGGIEVVIYDYPTDEDYLVLMGLRHVSGTRKWDRYNQAKLIAELSSKGLGIDEISSKLGVPNRRAVQEQLDAYCAIQPFIATKSLYEMSPAFNPHDRFMIFVEVLLKRNVRNWMGWNSESKTFGNIENTNRFYSWITPNFIQEDDDEAGINDGELLDPIIINHKQIRELDEIIDDPDSLERLEQARSITEAIEQNDGYTKKKFSKEIKRAETILKNVKLGPSLELNNEDGQSLNNIKRLVNLMLDEQQSRS